MLKCFVADEGLEHWTLSTKMVYARFPAKRNLFFRDKLGFIRVNALIEDYLNTIGY